LRSGDQSREAEQCSYWLSAFWNEAEGAFHAQGHFVWIPVTFAAINILKPLHA
jgi:hypothetical protein